MKYSIFVWLLSILAGTAAFAQQTVQKKEVTFSKDVAPIKQVIQEVTYWLNVFLKVDQGVGHGVDCKMGKPPEEQRKLVESKFLT